MQQKLVTLNRERQPAYQSMHKSKGKKYNNTPDSWCAYPVRPLRRRLATQRHDGGKAFTSQWRTVSRSNKSDALRSTKQNTKTTLKAKTNWAPATCNLGELAVRGIGSCHSRRFRRKKCLFAERETRAQYFSRMKAFPRVRLSCWTCLAMRTDSWPANNPGNHF